MHLTYICVIIPIISSINKRRAGAYRGRQGLGWLNVDDVDYWYIASSKSSAGLTVIGEKLTTQINNVAGKVLNNVRSNLHIADGTSILDYDIKTGLFFFQFCDKCVECIISEDEYVFPVLINDLGYLKYSYMSSEVYSPALITFSDREGLRCNRNSGNIINTSILNKYKDRTFYALTCGSYKKNGAWFNIRGCTIILAENKGETIVLSWDEFISLLRHGLFGVCTVFGLDCECEDKMKLWHQSQLKNFSFINSDIIMQYNDNNFILWSDGVAVFSNNAHYIPRISEFGTPVAGSGCSIEVIGYNELLRRLI